MNAPTALRGVERVRHELKRRELTVQAVEAVTPHFRRITLVDDSLSDFVSASFDDHVKVFVGERDATKVRAKGLDGLHRQLAALEFVAHAFDAA
ncbi:MAG TPA: siderophore-interacting protein, partial [Burkholderiaceae bacterium]